MDGVGDWICLTLLFKFVFFWPGQSSQVNVKRAFDAFGGGGGGSHKWKDKVWISRWKPPTLSLLFFLIGEISPNLKTLPSEQAVFPGESFRNILPLNGKVKIQLLMLQKSHSQPTHQTWILPSKLVRWNPLFPRSGGWRMRPGKLRIDLVGCKHPAPETNRQLAPETPGLEDEVSFYSKADFFRCYVCFGECNIWQVFTEILHSLRWILSSNFLSNRILEDSDPKSVEIGDDWHSSKNQGYSWILCIIDLPEETKGSNPRYSCPLYHCSYSCPHMEPCRV